MYKIFILKCPPLHWSNDKTAIYPFAGEHLRFGIWLSFSGKENTDKNTDINTDFNTEFFLIQSVCCSLSKSLSSSINTLHYDFIFTSKSFFNWKTLLCVIPLKSKIKKNTHWWVGERNAPETVCAFPNFMVFLFAI